jgi:hypothetical protein
MGLTVKPKPSEVEAISDSLSCSHFTLMVDSDMYQFDMTDTEVKRAKAAARLVAQITSGEQRRRATRLCAPASDG